MRHQRKVVYWVNQRVTESFAFVYRNGWTVADHGDWPMGTFSYIEVRASDEDFRRRDSGMVQL